MFKSFTSWLFDGEIDSKLQKSDEILKYNSPINHKFILTCFMQVPKFNAYLNEELNSFELYRLDKMELLTFLKRCVIDLRLTSSRHYTWRNNRYIRLSKLHNVLSKRYPYLKQYEITTLCNTIDNMPKDEKDKYYATFGLDIVKEQKIKRRQKTKGGKTKKGLPSSKMEHNNEAESVIIKLIDFMRNFQFQNKQF